jgi:hypothetical protein
MIYVLDPHVCYFALVKGSLIQSPPREIRSHAASPDTALAKGLSLGSAMMPIATLSLFHRPACYSLCRIPLLRLRRWEGALSQLAWGYAPSIPCDKSSEIQSPAEQCARPGFDLSHLGVL